MTTAEDFEPLAIASEQKNDVVLEVTGVSKKFCRSLKRSLFYGLQDIASELLGSQRQSEQLRTNEFWALKDVNLTLRRGEALGLIGANGSGKTTLLRIISGLIRPDTGVVKVKGQVAPLIALGAGFNPVLTGRENIYANMSILGLSTKEIDELFQAVVDFAEIGDAIDAPVMSYSSGMAARLGFACAIHTEPDILLIDEVLAVGDVKFISKCHRRLHELREKGIAFILVSHNPQAILSMCQQAVYLQAGNVVGFGNAETVMVQYEEDLFLGSAERSPGIVRLPSKAESETLGLDISYLCFKSPEGKVLESPISSEPAHLCIGLVAHAEMQNVNLRVSIIQEGQNVLYFGGTNDKEVFHIIPGEHEIQIQMPQLGLAPGIYTMRVDVRRDSLYILDLIDSFNFVIKSNGKMSKSIFYQPRSWKLIHHLQQEAIEEITQRVSI